MIRLLIVKLRSGSLSEHERRWAVRYLILSVLLAVLAWGTLWRELPVDLPALPAGAEAALPLLHLTAALLAGLRKTNRCRSMLTVHGIFLVLYYLASLIGLSMLEGLLPPWTFAACAVLLLGMHTALLTGERGFIFGYSTSAARRASQILKRFHHAPALTSVIFLAWYHPLEHESISLVRFGVTALLLLHLGMAGTTLHRSIWWNTLTELLVAAMLVFSAAYSAYWQVLLVSVCIMFTCTSLYGLRWCRMAHMIIQGGLIALLVWSFLTRGNAGLWQPVVLPLSAYSTALILLAAAAVPGSRRAS